MGLLCKALRLRTKVLVVHHQAVGINDEGCLLQGRPRNLGMGPFLRDVDNGIP